MSFGIQYSVKRADSSKPASLCFRELKHILSLGTPLVASKKDKHYTEWIQVFDGNNYNKLYHTQYHFS